MYFPGVGACVEFKYQLYLNGIAYGYLNEQNCLPQVGTLSTLYLNRGLNLSEQESVGCSPVAFDEVAVWNYTISVAEMEVLLQGMETVTPASTHKVATTNGANPSFNPGSTDSSSPGWTSISTSPDAVAASSLTTNVQLDKTTERISTHPAESTAEVVSGTLSSSESEVMHGLHLATSIGEFTHWTNTLLPSSSGIATSSDRIASHMEVTTMPPTSGHSNVWTPSDAVSETVPTTSYDILSDVAPTFSTESVETKVETSTDATVFVTQMSVHTANTNEGTTPFTDAPVLYTEQTSSDVFTDPLELPQSTPRSDIVVVDDGNAGDRILYTRVFDDLHREGKPHHVLVHHGIDGYILESLTKDLLTLPRRPGRHQLEQWLSR